MGEMQPKLVLKKTGVMQREVSRNSIPGNCTCQERVRKFGDMRGRNSKINVKMARL